MIPYPVIASMYESGAIQLEDNAVRLNFTIIESEFPDWMPAILKEVLNDLEWQAFIEGYMMYTVTDEGYLLWNRTRLPFGRQ